MAFPNLRLADLSDDDRRVPEKFGRYRIIKRLGQGGMGSVYLARDTHLERLVALKIPDFGKHEGPDARRRFLEEARTAATLDHPYLCRVYETGEIEGQPYLTMAYIEGQSLAALIGDEGWPQRHVAALVAKLALALQQAHAQKVIHRDLKPANVMIKTAGQRREPVIVDFGLARRDNAQGRRLTESGQVVGTLGYMAPEQIRGDPKEIGPACDIYALGVILYELLTGRLPFSGSGLAVAGQILTQAPLPPSTHRSDIDPALEAICLKAMARAIGDRYGSMAELAAALTGFIHSFSTTQTPPASVDSTASPAPIPGERPQPARSNSLVRRLLGRLVENDPSRSAVATPEPVASEAPSPERRWLPRPWIVSAATLVASSTRLPLWIWPSIAAVAVLGVMLLFVVTNFVTDRGQTKIVVNGPQPTSARTFATPAGKPPARSAAIPVKLSLPLTRLVHVDEFNGPQRGLLRDLDIPHDPDHGQSDGVYFVYAPAGFRSWNIHPIRSEGTCEVVARVLSEDPSNTAAWSVLVFAEVDAGERGLLIKINKKAELFLEPDPFEKAQAFREIDLRMGPIAHPAIKRGSELNKLLLVMRKREVVIFVNGVQVCAPVRFDYDITPSGLGFGAAGPGKQRAEFDRLEIRETIQPEDAPAMAGTAPPVKLGAAEAADLPKSVARVAANPPEPITNSIGMKLVFIPAGTFLMGSPDEDIDARGDETPRHPVRITRPFYLGTTEVTVGQFRRFVDDAGYQTEPERDGKGGLGYHEETKTWVQSPQYTWKSPGFEQTDEFPVGNVTWNDAVAFAAWLSAKEGKIYRLPTEAEWEYACRAGTTTRFPNGDSLAGVVAVGNVKDLTAKERNPNWPTTIATRDGYVYSAPVGRFPPNAFGLYDMHGNLAEWCSDGHDADYYQQSPVDDPPGPKVASQRVVRGGGWYQMPQNNRSASRWQWVPGARYSHTGFRLALVWSGP